MRFVSAWALAGLLVATPAAAQLLPEGWEDRIQLHARARLRGEFVDWFRPSDPGVDSRYSFFGSRYRVGLTVHLPHARVVVEGQETVLANVPTRAVAPAPVGALGPGAVYFANTPASFQQEPFLKRAFLEVRRRGFSARLGRFEIRSGLETLPTNPSLAALKKSRIAERLVGPFGFTHVTRSFDALHVAYDRPGWNLAAYGSRVTQGGFEVSANTEVSDITLAGASATAKRFSDLDVPFDASVAYLFYQDGRSDTVKVDNRPLAVRELDRERIRIHTVAGHALTLFDLGASELDLLFWGTFQGGKWGSQSHFAWSFATEAGLRFPAVWSAPWLRVGINRASGDSDPNDGRHKSFFQYVPTARKYARLPFYNLMNNQDVFATLSVDPHSRVRLRADYHWLSLTEAADLWYQGGGVTKTSLFGFVGTPSGGGRDLAHVIDLSIQGRVTPWLAVEAYVGHAFGRRVVEASFEGTGATYGFLQTTLSF